MFKKIIINFILITTMLSPAMALAQSTIPKPDTLPGKVFDFTTKEGKQEAKDYLPTKFAPTLTGFFIGFASIMSFFGLMIAGIRYIMAYGREEETGAAKKMALWSVVGLLIALFSYAIVSIVAQLKVT